MEFGFGELDSVGSSSDVDDYYSLQSGSGGDSGFGFYCWWLGCFVFLQVCVFCFLVCLFVSYVCQFFSFFLVDVSFFIGLLLCYFGSFSCCLGCLVLFVCWLGFVELFVFFSWVEFFVRRQGLVFMFGVLVSIVVYGLFLDF